MDFSFGFGYRKSYGSNRILLRRFRISLPFVDNYTQGNIVHDRLVIYKTPLLFSANQIVIRVIPRTVLAILLCWSILLVQSTEHILRKAEKSNFRGTIAIAYFLGLASLSQKKKSSTLGLHPYIKFTE